MAGWAAQKLPVLRRGANLAAAADIAAEEEADVRGPSVVERDDSAEAGAGAGSNASAGGQSPSVYAPVYCTQTTEPQKDLNKSRESTAVVVGR